ncbi:hypothetical protein GCM10023177_19860 [Streptomyces violaceoruber]|nr:hypothetical protein JCM4020_78030 [Streptomyces coelicolor]
MVEGADTDADDACAWAERLGWAFGLIAEDPVARGAALVRLAETQRKVAEALARSNGDVAADATFGSGRAVPGTGLSARAPEVSAGPEVFAA